MPKECPVIVYFVEKDQEMQFANYVEAAQYLGEVSCTCEYSY